MVEVVCYMMVVSCSWRPIVGSRMLLKYRAIMGRHLRHQVIRHTPFKCSLSRPQFLPYRVLPFAGSRSPLISVSRSCRWSIAKLTVGSHPHCTRAGRPPAELSMIPGDRAFPDSDFLAFLPFSFHLAPCDNPMRNPPSSHKLASLPAVSRSNTPTSDALTERSSPPDAWG